MIEDTVDNAIVAIADVVQPIAQAIDHYDSVAFYTLGPVMLLMIGVFSFSPAVALLEVKRRRK